mgnify:CR=1 FL=1
MKPQYQLDITIKTARNGFVVTSTFLSKEEKYVAATLDEVKRILDEVYTEASEYNPDKEE